MPGESWLNVRVRSEVVQGWDGSPTPATITFNGVEFTGVLVDVTDAGDGCVWLHVDRKPHEPSFVFTNAQVASIE